MKKKKREWGGRDEKGDRRWDRMGKDQMFIFWIFKFHVRTSTYFKNSRHFRPKKKKNQLKA